MCDFVHVLWLRRLEAQLLVHQQIALQALSRGADIDVPQLSDLLDEFDRMLADEPEPSTDSPEMAELKKVLGVS